MCYDMTKYYFIFYLKLSNYMITYIKYVFIYVFKVNTYNFIQNFIVYIYKKINSL